jgi:pyruvate formate lyase activating enzyme
MTFTGRQWSLDALLKQVLKDKDYYQVFGGGVTVSGGEPLSQYSFVTEFFRRLHEQGVHTALDTCGLAPAAALEAVLPYTDAVLFDIKLLDPVLHKQHTGHSNEIILRNLTTVANTIRENGAMRLWIRTPLIPGSTATAKNIAAISRYIDEHLADVVERWELCTFNSACQQKYDKLGQTWTYEGCSLMDQGLVDTLQDVALSTGTPREKLVISGLIARESA